MDVYVSIRKELMKDYLRYIGEETPDGDFKLSHLNGVGKLIASLVRYSDIPLKAKPGDIRLLLPRCDSLERARYKFLYLDEESQAKINDYLEAAFELDFNRYWIQGLKLKLQQKDILIAYITSRNLISLNGDLETLKKRSYRSSTEELKNLTRKLLDRARYNDRIVRESMKKEINIL